MKPATPMTHLMTIVGSFQAKVVAARLGAEGIPAQLRGGIDGTYPIFDEVMVYVRADQAAEAREILLADAVEAAFEDLVDADQLEKSFRRAGEQHGDDLPSHTGEAVADNPPRWSRRHAGRLLAITIAVIVMLVVVGFMAVMSH